MGFLQLIPADELAAVYNPMTQALCLYAKGDAQKFTSGIEFYRDKDFVGGLKFNLMGWVGPLAPGTEPYEYRQCFANGKPPAQIIVQDSSGSHAVDVHWLGAGEEHLAAAPAQNGAETGRGITPNFDYAVAVRRAIEDLAQNLGSTTFEFEVLGSSVFTMPPPITTTYLTVTVGQVVRSGQNGSATHAEAASAAS